MDINGITQLVSALGFPIAAYGGLFWYIITRDKAERESRDAQEQRHKEEMDKITEALNNNTKAIVELSALIKSGGGDNG